MMFRPRGLLLCSTLVTACNGPIVTLAGSIGDGRPLCVAGGAADTDALDDVYTDALVLDGVGAVRAAAQAGALVVRARTGSAFARVGILYDLSSGELTYLDEAGRERLVEVTFAERSARVGRVMLPRPVAELRLLVRGGELSFLRAEPHALPPPCEEDSPPGVTSLAPSRDRLDSVEALVHPQSDWSTRSLGTCGSVHTPKIFTVHHTETPTVDTLSPEERLRQIQAFHIDTRGWCDIGYHFLVSADGQLWHGRKTETRTGAHVENHNTGNLGVAFLGSFQTDAVPDVMIARAAELLRALSAGYSVPLITDKVLGHRQWSDASTSCPGDKLLARLGELLDAALDGDGDGTDQAGDCDDANPNAWISCATCVDGDRDGYYAGCDRYLSVNGPDCNDGDSLISPARPEILSDGIDQNCDGSDSVTCYVDEDGDGYGSQTSLAPQAGKCAFAGASAVSTDCDDAAESVHPGAVEFCDELDSDCDGGLADRFADADRDGLPDCVDASFDAPTVDPGLPEDTTPDEPGSPHDDDEGCAATPGAPLGLVVLLLACATVARNRR